MNYYNKITNILEEVKWPNTRTLSGSSRAYRRHYRKAQKSNSTAGDRHYAFTFQKNVPQSDERKRARSGQTGHWADKRTAKVRIQRDIDRGLR